VSASSFMVRHPSKKLEAKDLKKLLALGMLGLLMAFAMALGTSATFRDYNASRSVHWYIVPDDVEFIDLTPLQPYAYIDNDTGMLVIDFSANNPNYPGYGDGISPASEYNFDEVFEVSNDLWENTPIVVLVNATHPHITLYGEVVKNPPNPPVPLAYKVPYNATNPFAMDSDSAGDAICFVVQPGDAVWVGIDLSADGDNPWTWWNSTIKIKAWRLGTEPAYLNHCGGGS